MNTEMNVKQVLDPFQLKELEEVRGDAYNSNVTLQYVAMMSGVDLSFMTEDEHQYESSSDEGISLMSELDEEVQTEPKSAKYNIAVAWWQLWHSETVINNAVEKRWITEQEAQKIMTM